ncbi:hypothetical protein HMPREF9019_2063 [Hoylesella timonensis CRIS 5C-B1]|uniref:Uncharacterized protein n=1 Tax=Hoylesella timonensis CRIS 5C-B1 TaxID=679189 RepID=D1VZN7_9BACT|nr:hypothetical protein HMPREF9019_2063 [Hoylesella timonensis CRIS 5C-B1]
MHFEVESTLSIVSFSTLTCNSSFVDLILGEQQQTELGSGKNMPLKISIAFNNKNIYKL